jgi:hypothetical protein
LLLLPVGSYTSSKREMGERYKYIQVGGPDRGAALFFLSIQSSRHMCANSIIMCVQELVWIASVLLQCTPLPLDVCASTFDLASSVH